MAAMPDEIKVKVTPEVDWERFEGELISVSSWRQPGTIAAIVTAIAAVTLVVLSLVKEH